MDYKKHTGAKTRKQMADEYGISRKTFIRWRKKKGIVLSSGLITPKEQETIYKAFGKPKISLNVP